MARSPAAAAVSPRGVSVPVVRGPAGPGDAGCAEPGAVGSQPGAPGDDS